MRAVSFKEGSFSKYLTRGDTCHKVLKLPDHQLSLFKLMDDASRPKHPRLINKPLSVWGGGGNRLKISHQLPTQTESTKIPGTPRIVGPPSHPTPLKVEVEWYGGPGGPTWLGGPTCTSCPRGREKFSSLESSYDPFCWFPKPFHFFCGKREEKQNTSKKNGTNNTKITLGFQFIIDFISFQ